MKTLQLAFLLLLSIALIGQSEVSDRELTVEKSYSNEIYEVNPIFDYAAILVPELGDSNFDFDSLSTMQMQTPDLDVSIQPLAFQTNTKQKGRAGFVKLDKGMINPLHAQGGYTLSKANYYNLHLLGKYDHRDVSAVPSKYTKTLNANLGFDYYLTKDVKTNVNLNYNRQHYGLYSTLAPAKDDPLLNQQIFENKSFALGLETMKTFPRKWNFGLQTGLTQWSHGDVSEYNLTTLGSVKLSLDKNWGLSLQPFFNTSQSGQLENADVVGTSLSVLIDGHKFYSSLGAKLNYANEKINIWPALDIRWTVGKETEIYISSDANAEILGGQALSTINPYTSVNTMMEGKYSSLSSDLRLDVYSDLNAETHLSFSLNYLKAENHVNFVLNGTDARTFDTQLVDYQRLQVSTKLTRKVNDLLSAALLVKYNNYTKNMDQLLHRPVFIAEPAVTARLLSSKLLLGLQGSLNSPQYNMYTDQSVAQTGWRKNVSFSAGWDVMDQLRFHLNVDNIFNDDYQVWSGYESFERNVSGGVLFVF